MCTCCFTWLQCLNFLWYCSSFKSLWNGNMSLLSSGISLYAHSLCLSSFRSDIQIFCHFCTVLRQKLLMVLVLRWPFISWQNLLCLFQKRSRNWGWRAVKGECWTIPLSPASRAFLFTSFSFAWAYKMWILHYSALIYLGPHSKLVNAYFVITL